MHKDIGRTPLLQVSLWSDYPKRFPFHYTQLTSFSELYLSYYSILASQEQPYREESTNPQNTHQFYWKAAMESEIASIHYSID